MDLYVILPLLKCCKKFYHIVQKAVSTPTEVRLPQRIQFNNTEKLVDEISIKLG